MILFTHALELHGGTEFREDALLEAGNVGDAFQNVVYQKLQGGEDGL